LPELDVSIVTILPKLLKFYGSGKLEWLEFMVRMLVKSAIKGFEFVEK
jgi:hypothetical protein